MKRCVVWVAVALTTERAERMERVQLPASAYGIVDRARVAHIRREGVSYCGRPILGPVPTGENRWRTAEGYATGQHCIDCDKAFRAEHRKYPITFEF